MTIILGGCATLAFPPLNLIPLFFIAVPVMLWMLNQTQSASQAFWCGWGFGLGYFVVGLYWISNALTFDLARWWWLWPFATLGLPAFLACFHALAAAAYYRLARRLQMNQSVLLFALLWSLAEWLRGHILTGFPWQLAGYIWDAIPEVLQFTSLVGIYGLSLVTICVAVLPASFEFGRARQGAVTLLAGWGVVAAIFGYGSWRLSSPESEPVPQLTLLLVQPNIEQGIKWDIEYREANFQLHLDMTRQALTALGESHLLVLVIWPEAASTFLLERDDEHRQAIAEVTPSHGFSLIGSPRVRWQDSQAHYWNSMLAIAPSGQVVASYDKAHLVPFGEYIPLHSWLSQWKQLRAFAGSGVSFSAGPGNRTIQLNGFPSFSPLICYEVIFPRAVVDRAQRPGWLVNLTNDGWYGNSAGPYQHFAIARVRAIEEGLPLVRVANTGISGVIDPHGRILARQALGSKGVVTAKLPTALPATLYATYGDLMFAGLLGLVTGLIWVVRCRTSTAVPVLNAARSCQMC